MGLSILILFQYLTYIAENRYGQKLLMYRLLWYYINILLMKIVMDYFMPLLSERKGNNQ